MPWNFEKLSAAIAEESNDSLSKEPGMVYQVFEDGEVTLQKSGDLLWQRTLHCIMPPFKEAVSPELFPHKMNGHGYAFVTRDGAERIRALIAAV
jgi:hypothetical protein